MIAGVRRKKEERGWRMEQMDKAIRDGYVAWLIVHQRMREIWWFEWKNTI
jgi:hypothetical protein